MGAMRGVRNHRDVGLRTAGVDFVDNMEQALTDEIIAAFEKERAKFARV